MLLAHVTTVPNPDVRLGHYHLLSLLGEGGMGAVYLAEDTKLGRMVAVKTLPLNSNEEAKRRFIREARAVAALDHPNICTIHEVGEEHGQSYIVMQHVDGETLASCLNSRKLTLERSLDCAIQICEALQAAHDRGIIHRDVKPSNVIVTSSGNVKVLDFGLAKVLDQETEQTDLLTRPGMVAGTRPYMSPEQLRGQRLDSRSDIFSFGVMLYEMVSGRRPFDGDSTEATITAILFFDPPKIEATSPALAEIESVIRKALQKDRDRRYRRIADIGDELRRIRTSLASDPGAIERKAANVEVTESVAVVMPRPRKRAFDSIAIIPRVISKTDPELIYLLEGIAEGVIDQLSRTPRLRVLARSTAFHFEEAALDLQALRRTLNLSSIATISMTVEGQQIEVTIQLMRTDNGESLLSRKYSSSIDSPYRIAEEAARDLLAIVRPASSRKRRSSRAPTIDPQAYHTFLKARFQWNKRTPEGLKQAIDLYERAIETDPTFAAPYAGLADAYNFLGFFLVMPARMVFARAKAAAKRAIELDPAAGEAYASLGFGTGMYDWNFPEAIRLMDEAIQRNPNYGWAYQWRGLMGHMPLGQFEEAVADMRLAEELDPLAPIMSVGAGVALSFARRYEESRRILERSRELYPKVGCTHGWLGFAYEQLGRYDDALAAMTACHNLEPSSLSISWLCHCYAAAGRRDEALKLLAQTMEQSDRAYISPYVSLMAYIGLGDKDRALESLHAAVEERSSWLYAAKVDPRFDRVREWMGSGLEKLLDENILQS